MIVILKLIGSLTVNIDINDMPISWLVDTGSAVSLLNVNVASQLNLSNKLAPYLCHDRGITCQNLNVVELVKLRCNFQM